MSSSLKEFFPVNETDSLTTTSPIRLVAKRKSNISHVAQGNEAHLTV